MVRKGQLDFCLQFNSKLEVPCRVLCARGQIFHFIWKSLYFSSVGGIFFEANLSIINSIYCLSIIVVLKSRECWLVIPFVMLCAIWYFLYNFKNLKNTHGGMLILVKLQPTTLLKLTILNGCFWLLNKTWSFPLRISSVNWTKFSVSCEFDHIYWRNP